VSLDGAGGVDHWFEAAVGGPKIPPLQEGSGLFKSNLLVEILKGKPDLVAGESHLEFP
jgi:hypothetical protein